MADEAEKIEAPTREKPYRSDAERDHFAAIGRVAGEWAFLEFIIDWRTAQLLEINDDVMACLLSQIVGPARKMDAYIAAVTWRGVSSLNKRLQEFAKETASLGEARNRIVHDSWVLEEHGPHRYEMTGRRKIRRKLISTPTSEVIDLSFRIREHELKLYDLHEEVLSLLGKPQLPTPGSG